MKRCFLTGQMASILLFVFVNLLHPSHADDSATPSEPEPRSEIRVALITQQDGPHLGIYFPAIANSSSISRVAVADSSGTTFESAKRMLGKHADFEPYRDSAVMIRDFRPNLVVLALAAHRAPARIQEALAAGCHVLAEKPACVRVEDFRPLVKLAKENKLNLMLALPSRLAPDTLRAKEIVDAGWLEKPYGVTFFQVKDQARLTSPTYQKSSFAHRDKAGGGHLIWLGIHNLDQVFFITNDRVEQVSGFTHNGRDRRLRSGGLQIPERYAGNISRRLLRRGWKLSGRHNAVGFARLDQTVRLSRPRRFASRVPMVFDVPGCPARRAIRKRTGRRQLLSTARAGSD